VPGDEQEQGEVDDLVRRDAIAVGLYVEQGREEVIPRPRAPDGEEILQVCGRCWTWA
jgi:hypothetical protein